MARPLQYFMLFGYTRGGEPGKDSPTMTLTRLLPSVRDAKTWLAEEASKNGGVWHLYRDTRKIAVVRSRNPRRGSRSPNPGIGRYEFTYPGQYGERKVLVSARSIEEAKVIAFPDGPPEGWSWRKISTTMKGRRGQSLRPNPMQTYYRLESSMGGYLGVSNTLQKARKLARTWSKSYGYAVNIFKAKRDALKETRGDLVQVVAPPKTGRPQASASAWIPSRNPADEPQFKRGIVYTVRTKRGDVRATYAGRTFLYYFFRPIDGGREIQVSTSTIRSRVQNPGPSALPSKWTPATVTRKGSQIQIRVGRGR